MVLCPGQGQRWGDRGFDLSNNQWLYRDLSVGAEPRPSLPSLGPSVPTFAEPLLHTRPPSQRTPPIVERKSGRCVVWTRSPEGWVPVLPVTTGHLWLVGLNVLILEVGRGCPQCPRPFRGQAPLPGPAFPGSRRVGDDLFQRWPWGQPSL